MLPYGIMAKIKWKCYHAQIYLSWNDNIFHICSNTVCIFLYNIHDRNTNIISTPINRVHFLSRTNFFLVLIQQIYYQYKVSLFIKNNSRKWLICRRHTLIHKKRIISHCTNLVSKYIYIN